MTKPVAVKTSKEVEALETGTRFSIRLPKTLTWHELHRVLYRTANREVTLTLRTGEKITGRLDETPGYFSQSTKAGARLWLRVEGRKTRKPIPVREIRHLIGYKAPSLAEALTSFIYLTSSNPSAEQVHEARAIVAQM